MNYKRGFTLIEIIVVVAILTVVVAFGATVDFSSFTSNEFQGEESKLVSVLERARSHSMANIYESAYGVCFISGDYVIFRDGTCDKSATDETISANSNIAITFSTSPVVFERLSGKLTPELSPVDSEITITVDNGRGSPKYIRINNEGTINW